MRMSLLEAMSGIAMYFDPQDRPIAHYVSVEALVLELRRVYQMQGASFSSLQKSRHQMTAGVSGLNWHDYAKLKSWIYYLFS
jgi:hypothetical protein